MADPFDITRPSPDAGHEAIRVAVVQAIEELGYTSSDLSFSFDLVDFLFVLIEQTLATKAALQAEVAALAARVDALEAAAQPEEPLSAE